MKDSVSCSSAATEETMSYRKKQLNMLKEAAVNSSQLDLNIDLKTNLKLADQVKRLIDLDTNGLDLCEKQMNDCIHKFIMPNNDDKTLLKWLLGDGNFRAHLQRPCTTDAMLKYLLTPIHLNITVEDDSSQSLSPVDDLDDQTYLSYNSSSGRLCLLVNKIEHVLSREKELQEQQTLSNTLSKEKLDEFRLKYIENANFVGAQCLLGIVKKKSSSLLSQSNLLQQQQQQQHVNNKSALSESSPLEIAYSDLSEKLFSCILSNYSCELSNYFLDSANGDTVETFGFVRKHGADKSFSLVTLDSEEVLAASRGGDSSELNGSASLRMSNVKFCFKLDKWPAGEFNLTRRLSNVANTKLLNNLEIDTCLIKIGKFLCICECKRKTTKE